MAGFWTHRFNIVLRPLRDRAGAQTTIVLESRTAAQATREATIRHPDMKVIQVSRVVESVPVLTPRAGVHGSTDSQSTDDDAGPVAIPHARRA